MLNLLIDSFVVWLVRQLHREFLRAGADIIQAFTFSLEDNLVKFLIPKSYFKYIF